MAEALCREYGPNFDHGALDVDVGVILMENYLDWIDEDRSLKPGIVLQRYKNILLFYDHDWEIWRHVFDFSESDSNIKFIVFDIGMESFEIKIVLNISGIFHMNMHSNHLFFWTMIVFLAIMSLSEQKCSRVIRRS